MSLKKLIRKTEEDQNCPVEYVHYNGPSPYFRKGYDSYDLTIEIDEKRRRITNLIPLRIEQSQTTCVRCIHIPVNKKRHLILGLSEEDIETVKEKKKWLSKKEKGLIMMRKGYDEIDHDITFVVPVP